MNRNDFILIRNTLDLRPKPLALGAHIAENMLLAVAIFFCWQGLHESLFRYIVIPLLSIFIFRHFSIMHDAAHRVVSKTKFINDLVGLIGGGFCLLPFEPWKKSHMQHHYWSGNIDKDPVTAFISIYPKMSRTSQNVLNVLWRSWFPILGLIQNIVFWFLSFKTYLNEPRSMKLAVSLIFPVVLWSSIVTMLPLEFTLSALLPSVLLYLLAVEVVNLPHHLQLPQFRGDTHFQAWQQYQTARTCIYPKWFARFVVLNFNYHIEHHLFPDVPWYHLDRLHVEVKNLIQESYNTDPYFKWIRENKPRTIDQVLAPQDDHHPSEKKQAA